MGRIRSSKFFICFITGLIIGTLIGTIILSIIVSYRMDQYHEKILSLEDIIQDKDIKLEKLEEAETAEYISLKDIVVELEFDGDGLDKIDMEKAIKEKYISLIGKDVKNMDGNILAEVVDKRIFKIEEKEYRVEVKKLILSEVLRLYIKIEEKNN